jgi:ABC-type amino acid transport system permease subunit
MPSLPKNYYLDPPDGVPSELVVPSSRYRGMVFTVLATMFLFLAFYFGLILACLAAIYFLISFSANSPVRVRILFVAVFSVIPTLVLLFLMKGLFRFLRPNKEPYVEITKEEQPRLFRFLERLCE